MSSSPPSDLMPEALRNLWTYRAALLVVFPRGSNMRAKRLRPGAIARVNDAFKALVPKHKRRLDRLRCTIDRLLYIERVMQKEVPMRQ